MIKSLCKQHLTTWKVLCDHSIMHPAVKVPNRYDKGSREMWSM